MIQEAPFFVDHPSLRIGGWYLGKLRKNPSFFGIRINYFDEYSNLPVSRVYDYDTYDQIDRNDLIIMIQTNKYGT